MDDFELLDEYSLFDTPTETTVPTVTEPLYEDVTAPVTEIPQNETDHTETEKSNYDELIEILNLYGDVESDGLSQADVMIILELLNDMNDSQKENLETIIEQQEKMLEISEQQTKDYSDIKTFLIYIFVIVLAFGIYKIVSGMVNGAFGG